MRVFFILLVSGLTLVSCMKDSPQSSTFSEARYRITITGKWSSPSFTVPSGAHYTTFIGMVHNSKALLWKENLKASPGMKLLVETGNGGLILPEIDSMTAEKKALSLILFVAPAINTSAGVNIYCNSNYSSVSFASMLGPTPDWFVGISNLNLYNNNRWIADTTIDLYAYDAGTEEGDQFGYNNPPTYPQQHISLLSASSATVLANGNPTLAPIARAQLVKQ